MVGYLNDCRDTEKFLLGTNRLGSNRIILYFSKRIQYNLVNSIETESEGDEQDEVLWKEKRTYTAKEIYFIR